MTWPKALNVTRHAANSWHGDISFARFPTDEELTALHEFLRLNHEGAPQPSPAATVETTGEELRKLNEEIELVRAAALEAEHPRSSAATEDALGYAQRLATILWEKHWKDGAPEWRPLPDVVGVLTQIDNMVAGLSRAAPQAVSVPWKGNLSVDLRKGALRINADGVTLIDEAGTCWAIVFPDKTGSYDHAATITSLLSRPTLGRDGGVK